MPERFAEVGDRFATIDDASHSPEPLREMYERDEAEGEGDIQFESGENHLFFEVGGRMLISRMIDGQFPAYERVIPKGNDKTIEFDRERLTSAVKRVALLSNERSRAVKFEIDMLRCIYCGMCQEVCPEEAIFLQNQYSMTGYTREEMVNDKARLYELGGTLPDQHFKWDRKKAAEEHGNDRH
jgi:ferredoxin